MEMKMRTGFVSNSSSASYMVDIDVDTDKFIKTMKCEYSWSFLSWKKIRKYYKGLLQLQVKNRMRHFADMGDELSKHNDEPGWYDVSWHKRAIASLDIKIENSKEMISRFYEASEYIDSDEMVFEFFSRKGIIIRESVEGKTSFICDASMHNDYVSALPDIVKEIILYYSFDTDIQVKCVRHGGDE